MSNATAYTPTIADRPDPLSRAMLIADQVNVDVCERDFGKDASDAGALYFQGIDGDGVRGDCVILASDLTEDERAAQLFFVLAIICADRDVSPGLAISLVCHEPGAGAEFIAVSRKRLPGPTGAGFGRLAAMMGKSAGLTEPAVFEVIR